MLVAPRRTSAGEPSPAHHPRHDLAQGPPRRHPQSSHLRHPQAATVIDPPTPSRAVQRSIGSTQWTPIGFQSCSPVHLPSYLHILSDAREPHLCLILFYFFLERERELDCFRAAIPGFPSVHPFVRHPALLDIHSARSMKLLHIFEHLTSWAGVEASLPDCPSWHCLLSKPVAET